MADDAGAQLRCGLLKAPGMRGGLRLGGWGGRGVGRPQVRRRQPGDRSKQTRLDFTYGNDLLRRSAQEGWVCRFLARFLK